MNAASSYDSDERFRFLAEHGFFGNLAFEGLLQSSRSAARYRRICIAFLLHTRDGRLLLWIRAIDTTSVG